MHRWQTLTRTCRTCCLPLDRFLPLVVWLEPDPRVLGVLIEGGLHHPRNDLQVLLLGMDPDITTVRADPGLADMVLSILVPLGGITDRREDSTGDRGQDILHREDSMEDIHKVEDSFRLEGRVQVTLQGRRATLQDRVTAIHLEDLEVHLEEEDIQAATIHPPLCYLQEGIQTQHQEPHPLLQALYHLGRPLPALLPPPPRPQQTLVLPRPLPRPPLPLPSPLHPLLWRPPVIRLQLPHPSLVLRAPPPPTPAPHPRPRLITRPPALHTNHLPREADLCLIVRQWIESGRENVREIGRGRERGIVIRTGRGRGTEIASLWIGLSWTDLVVPANMEVVTHPEAPQEVHLELGVATPAIHHQDLVILRLDIPVVEVLHLQVQVTQVREVLVVTLHLREVTLHMVTHREGQLDIHLQVEAILHTDILELVVVLWALLLLAILVTSRLLAVTLGQELPKLVVLQPHRMDSRIHHTLDPQ